MNDERMERLGWRGIGVAQVTLMAGNEMYDDCWLAATIDPDDGQPALSVWEGDSLGAAQCHIGLWLTPKGALRLADELRALAEAGDDEEREAA